MPFLQVFSREDYRGGEENTTVVKVTNTKLNVCTHWSLTKFEEKLAQMRDIFQVWLVFSVNMEFLILLN